MQRMACWRSFWHDHHSPYYDWDHFILWTFRLPRWSKYQAPALDHRDWACLWCRYSHHAVLEWRASILDPNSSLSCSIVSLDYPFNIRVSANQHLGSCSFSTSLTHFSSSAWPKIPPKVARRLHYSETALRLILFKVAVCRGRWQTASTGGVVPPPSTTPNVGVRQRIGLRSSAANRLSSLGFNKGVKMRTTATTACPYTVHEMPIFWKLRTSLTMSIKTIHAGRHEDDMTSGIDGAFSNTRGVTTVYTMIPTQHPFTTSNKHIYSSQPRSKTYYPYPSIVYKKSHHQCELSPHYHVTSRTHITIIAPLLLKSMNPPWCPHSQRTEYMFYTGSSLSLGRYSETYLKY